MTSVAILTIRRRALSGEGRAILDNIDWQPLPAGMKGGFKKLIEGRNLLRAEFLEHTKGGDHHGRDFSLDGRLVGDIGELVGAFIAPITLTGGAGAEYDGFLKTNPKKLVQIRCSLRDDSISINHGEGYFLGIQLTEEDGGQFRVVFDGPADRPWHYVNADKSTGVRDSKREQDRTLKSQKLGTWVLLNEAVEERFVTP